MLHSGLDVRHGAAPSGISATETELWVFGYGSLIFRPDFPFVVRCEGFIRGWSRRFWQASTDHRGTPDAPGRVATLVESAGDRCWGVAYQVAPADASSVLALLDHRERQGHERRVVPFFTSKSEAAHALATVYVADGTNPNYVGPEELAQIVAIVAAACGPSGANRVRSRVFGVAVHHERLRLVLLAQRVIQNGLFGMRVGDETTPEFIERGLPTVIVCAPNARADASGAAALQAHPTFERPPGTQATPVLLPLWAATSISAAVAITMASSVIFARRLSIATNAVPAAFATASDPMNRGGR